MYYKIIHVQYHLDARYNADTSAYMHKRVCLHALMCSPTCANAFVYTPYAFTYMQNAFAYTCYAFT